LPITTLDPSRCACFAGGAQCEFHQTREQFCDRCTARQCRCPCRACEQYDGVDHSIRGLTPCHVDPVSLHRWRDSV
jgi:hypothetical protein